jgi:UrcA family protein
MKHTTQKTRALVYALPLLLSAAGALANAPKVFNLVVTPTPVAGEPLELMVSYGDLNLDRSQGVTVLYRRLENAVQYVCHPFDSRVPAKQTIFLKCQAESMAAAVLSVNNANLSALHALRVGSTPVLAAQAVR